MQDGLAIKLKEENITEGQVFLPQHSPGGKNEKSAATTAMPLVGSTLLLQMSGRSKKLAGNDSAQPSTHPYHLFLTMGLLAAPLRF